jgi:hypothetical protein
MSHMQEIIDRRNRTKADPGKELDLRLGRGSSGRMPVYQV